jgi:O-antigen/teichoic acid export membrane protein
VNLRALGRGTRGRMLIAFGGGAVPVLAGLALVPLTLRSLGPETFAWISVSWILLGNTSWVDLGLGRALVQRLAARSRAGDEGDQERLLGTALSVQTALGALLVAAIVGGALALPQVGAAEALQVLCVAAGLLPALWANTLRSALEARLEFASAARVRVPISLALLAWPCALGALGAPLWASLLGLGGVKALAAGGYARLLARRCDLLARLRFSGADARELLTFGGWSSVSSLAGPILGYAERGLLAALGSGALLGVYAALLEVLQRALIVPASMASVLFPSLSGSLEDGRGAHTERLLRQSLFALNLLVWPALALFWIGAEFGLGLLLGEHLTAGAVRASRWLALAVALNAFAHLPYSVLYAAGRPGVKARLDLIELPLYLGLSALLITHYGLLGAAWAKAAVSLADLAALTFLARRELGETRDARAWSVQARFALGAALAAAGAWIAAGHGLGAAWALAVWVTAFGMAFTVSGARPAELWRRPVPELRPLVDDPEASTPAA